MKICQVNNKIIFFSVLLLVFIFSSFFVVNSTNADTAGGAVPISEEAYDKLFGGSGSMFGSKIKCGLGSQAQADAVQNLSLETGKILVSDSGATGALAKIICIDDRNGVERAMDFIAETVAKEWKWALEEGAAVAYKAALKNFLNTLAYDTATYLATGEKGQKPMFITEGWGEYLKNTADNSAGTFLETLGKKGPLKFNLCQPDFEVQIKIGLGLLRKQRPKAPECTFSKMVKNWDEALSSPTFLSDFQNMFNPWENDLGIALTLQTGIEAEISNKLNEATQKRITNKGWLSVKSLIGDKILTPATYVSESGKIAYENSFKNYMIYTGSAAADAIDVFINTLVGKLMDKWLKQGLVTSFPDNSYDWSKLGDYSGSPTREGIAGAKERLRSLVEPSFAVRGDYNILAELTMCPDPNKAGPTNCVIDSKFSQAISEKKTVGQALSEGYLNPNGIFGFSEVFLLPAFI